MNGEILPDADRTNRLATDEEIQAAADLLNNIGRTGPTLAEIVDEVEKLSADQLVVFFRALDESPAIALTLGTSPEDAQEAAGETDGSSPSNPPAAALPAPPAHVAPDQRPGHCP
jgi:hypothetical protein